MRATEAQNRKSKIQNPHCPLCGYRRAWVDFLMGPRSPVLSVFCRRCREKHPDWETRAMTGTLEWRRLVWAALRELVQATKRGMDDMAEDYSTRVSRLPDRVAAILAETYAVLGDDAFVADDTAMAKVLDLIDEIDPSLITHHRSIAQKKADRIRRLKRRAS